MSSLFEVFTADVERFTRSDLPMSRVRLVTKTLIEPGLLFVWLARVQIALELKGSFSTARLIHLLNLRITGGELGHGCRIGRGLVVKHPLGVVIGGGTKIGERCTILRNVTFGERKPVGDTNGHDKYPSIGSDCMFGTGATVLGDITVGDSVQIGAHALVLSDIPSGVTAVGAPAKPIKVVESGV